MTTTIRLVTPADSPQILAIYNPIIRDTAISFEYDLLSNDAMAERITKYTAQYPWLVCAIDGQIAGYAYGSQHRGRTAYQWSVEVSAYVHEFFYPLMQGYDAVAQKTDVQIGGQDQLFNLMAGRQLMDKMGVPPQIVIALGESLPGTDGVLKMSKSKGNHIPLLTDALDMFGKVMSIPDEAMAIYFKLLLGKDESEIEAILKGHPREVKAGLARQIIAIYHPDSDPPATQAEWERM